MWRLVIRFLSVALMLLVVAAATSSVRTSAQTCFIRPVILAPGFEYNVFADTTSVPDFNSKISGPSCITFDSRGRLFVGTLAGKILILPDDTDQGKVDAANIKAFASGLPDLQEPLGIEFRANGDLYATSNVLRATGQVGRILRLRDTRGDDVADDVRVVLDGLPSAGDHQTDRLKFGPDGLLYIGQGSATDDGTPDSPGSPAEGPLNGTFLRINVDDASPQLEIFAKGLRNPFGMAFDPVSGALFSTDVGAGELCQVGPCPPDTSPNEKILWIFQGGNYGFPNCWIPAVSNPACPGVTGPLAQFIPHLTPTSIAFYTGPQAQASGLLNQMLVTPLKRLYSSADGDFVGGDVEQFVLTGSSTTGFQLTRVPGPSIAAFQPIDPNDGPVDTAIDPLSGDIYVARLDPIDHPPCPPSTTPEHHNIIYRIHRAGSDSLPFIGPLHPAMIDGQNVPVTIAVFGRHIKQGATVLADGAPLVTRRVSQLELDADLPAALTSTSHTFAMTVSNPDGTLSNPQPLQVVHSGGMPLTLTSVTVTKKSGKVVNQLAVGMKAKKLLLIADGTGFDSGAELLVNGTQLSLISASGTELIGGFTNDLLAAPGTLTIQVKDSNGTVSNTMTLTVVAAQRLSPIQGRRGDGFHSRQ